MKKTATFFISFLLSIQFIAAQSVNSYSTAQAHSHNDYERSRPFEEAYEQQFGSVEADVFLVNDTLYVAHNLKDIRRERTFSALYLLPILQKVEQNGGRIYPQDNVPLQLLIDLKTEGEPTLAALVKVLEPHKKIFAPAGSVRIVVSGNVPDPSLFEQYPDFIYFDGRPENVYTPAQMAHVGLISQAFQKYSKWNGEGPILEKDKRKIRKMVNDVHDLGKKVRIWATPDNINSWKTMMALGVDYINTDKVQQLGDYLRTAPR
ncbi:phosphatidylinositol-specific phospholipase C/glycerophosphodiester phosphodiesterase family protein [Dyadobacter fermentans]|uniref:Altered inheritance of mitochondria protein 6 n=1 Tax=Dyadobacter fermentans (strain ATCC 700827 / DSM 18053 / CIP 107007 / KCTC 52180 / NS114) TaxID=471854 RepID=C6W5T4_DYAFD|nr:phosphatidylinositol-specific phospholipase C/glycerophosphodiester phosphodiesterase family protein [Dyadobacter fermentans]ACT96023.1 alkaline phosphatase [Dyadobacter fermentans DSM 18053]